MGLDPELFADGDGDTKITLDTAGGDTDTITLFSDGVEVFKVEKTAITISVDGATDSTSATTGALIVNGGVGITKTCS